MTLERLKLLIDLKLGSPYWRDWDEEWQWLLDNDYICAGCDPKEPPWVSLKGECLIDRILALSCIVS